MKTTTSAGRMIRAALVALLVLTGTVAPAQWTNIYSNTSSFYDLEFTSSTTGYMQDIYKMYKTTNGGTAWTLIDSTSTQFVRTDMYWLNSNEGFVVFYENLGFGNYAGWFRKTTNGGSSWTAMQQLPVNELYSSIFFTSSTTGFVAGTDGRILRTTNGGATWTSMTSGTTQNLMKVFFPTPSIGYAAGDGIILKTNNGGTTWTQQFSNINYDFTDAWFTDQNNGMMIGTGGMVRTTNGGSSWNAITGLQINQFIAVHFPSQDTGYVTGVGGNVYRTTDGGATWLGMNRVGGNMFTRDIYFVSNDTGYAVQDYTGVYKTTTAAFACPYVFFGSQPSALDTVQTCAGNLNNLQVTPSAPNYYPYGFTPSAYVTPNFPPSYFYVSIPNPGDTVSIVVTMTDTISGCPSTTDTIVYVTDSITYQPNQNGPTILVSLCPGDSVTLDLGSNAQDGYSWQSLSDTTQTITVDTSGIWWGYAHACGGQYGYIFIVQFDTNACNQVCSVDAGPDTTLCGYAPYYYQLNATPGSPGNYSYSWSPATGLDNPNVQNPHVNEVINVTYTVTITDNVSGCTAIDSVTITSLNVRHDTVYNCNSSSVLLEVLPGGSIYNWGGPNGPFPNSNGIIVGTPGQYFVVASYPAYSCAVTSAFLVIDTCACSVDAGPDTTFCQSQNPQLNATPAFPGNYTYSWSPATGLSDPNIANPLVHSVHNQQYVVTMTDVNSSCTDTDTIIVSAYNTVTDTLYNCNGSPLVLDFGPGASSYYWQYYTDPQGNVSMINGFSQTLTVTQPGTYLGYATFNNCGALTSLVTVMDSCSSTCTVDAGPDTTFCQSQNPQLNATPGQPGSYTYQWSPATGLSNPFIANPTVYGVHNQWYTVTITDTSGCTATDSVLVSEYHFTANDTSYICDSSYVTLDFGPGAANYFWQFYTDTAGNTTPLNINTQTLTVNQPGSYGGIAFFPGCGALTSVFNVVDSCGVFVGNVWPGDCNYDLTVNMADVLNIGIAYNTSGPARPNATTLWYAQPMADWTPNFNNCNYKHADTDGNGLINVNDTLAVSNNYSLTHPYRLAAPSTVNPLSTPTLELVANYDTCGLQTLVTVDIRLGSSSVPVDSIYGISFRLNIEASLIDTMASSMDFNGSWLGTIGTDLVGFRKPFRSSGIIDVAEVGNNQQNRLNGSGTIGTLRIVTTDNLSGIAILNLDVSDVTAITIGETQLPVNVVNDSVVIDPSVLSAVPHHTAETVLQVFPNPANESVTVNSNSIPAQIEVIDLLGQTLLRTKPASRNTLLEIGHLPSGVYLVRVQDGNGYRTEKLTITR